MSQNTQQEPDPKHALTLKQEKQEDPVTGVSPDDPFPVPSDDGGKPGG